MADAFRGLTIRLGADARPLSTAISSITKSAGLAQQQMNRLNKALKFDPGNAKILSSLVDLTGDKAAHSARQVQTLRTALNQAAAESKDLLKNSSFSNRSIKELANDYKQVYAATQKVRAESQHVEAELAHIYDAAKRVAKTDMGISWKKASKYVQGLQRNLSRGGAAADRAWEKLRKLFEKVDAEDGVFDMFKLAKGDVDGLIKKTESLRTEFKELDTDLKALRKVEGFRAIENDIMVAKAETRSLAAEAAKLRTEFHSLAGGRLTVAISQIERMKAATSKAVAEAHQMAEACKLAPKNIDLARAKTIAAKTAQETLAHQLKSVQTALEKIEENRAFNRMASMSKEAYVAAEKVEQEVENLNYKVRRLDAAIESMEADLKNATKNPGTKTEAEMDKLKGKIDKAKEAAANLRATLATLDDKHATASLIVQFRKLKSEEAALIAETAKLKASMSMATKLKNLGAGMRELGYGLYSTVTPALMMAGRYAIMSADKIDSAYRDMRKTVNGTEEQFEHLKQAALDFSATHVTSADTILEIEAMGGQLGIAADNLEAFSTTVSSLDIATNMQSDDIAEQLGKMASVIGIGVDQYENFGDSLVRLGNNMPVMESDIMTITTRFMGMGKIVGMSADEMLGWAAAASATGQKSEAAGSSMQRFVSKMETAVVSGGDALETYAGIAGMSAQEFADAFNTDASDAMYSFIHGLGDVQKAGGSVNQVLGELGINNVRDKQLLEGLANQMANGTDEANLLAQALRMSADAYNGLDTVMDDGTIEKAGDAAREAGRKSEGFSGELAKMKNNAARLAEAMGEGAAPIIKSLGEAFKTFADGIKGMPGELKTTVVAIMGFVAAVGPVSVAGGTILRAFTSIGQAVSNVPAKILAAGQNISWMGAEMAASAGKVTKSSKAVRGLGSVVQALGSGPAMLGIAGVAAAIALVVKSLMDAKQKADDFSKATNGLKASTDRVMRVVSDTAAATDAVGASSKAANRSIDDLVASHVELVDSMDERSKSAETEISQLKAAQAALDRYMNVQNLSSEQQRELTDAVDFLNTKYNAQYTVVDKANGKIADSKGVILNTKSAIDEYIQAKEKEIRLEALSADMAEMSAKRAEAAATYSQKIREYVDAYEKYASLSDTDSPEYKQSVSDDLDKAKLELDQSKAILDQDEEQLNRIKAQVEGVKSAVAETASSISAIAAGDTTLQEIFGDQQSLDSFASALEKCGMTVEEFDRVTASQWAEIHAKWAGGNEDLTSMFNEMGIKVHSVGEQFSVEMERVQSSADAFGEIAKAAGMGTDEFAQALSDAGISAIEFANVSKSNFDALWAVADGDFSKIRTAIDLIDAANLDPKNLEVNADGLLQIGEQVIDLDNMTVGDKTFEVTANGLEPVREQVEETDEALDELDGESATAEAEVEGTEEAEEQVQTLTEALNNVPDGESHVTVSLDGDALAKLDAFNLYKFDPKTVRVTADVNAAEAKFKAIKDIRFEPKTVSVGVVGGALSTLYAIEKELRDLNGRESTVTVTTIKKTKSEGSATGGIVPAHAMGALFPSHADGAINGIVTRAMMTNIGWVGEAGAEALFHMRNAGGAVVPLSNRRYVRPFAHAVASEMSGMYAQARAGSGTVVNVNLSYDASSDASQVAWEIADKLELVLNARGVA